MFIIESPFQYREHRSQSLSPYNDVNLLTILKKQIHRPSLNSFEYVQKPTEIIESNIITQESLNQYVNTTKRCKNSLCVITNPISRNSCCLSQDRHKPPLPTIPKVVIVKQPIRKKEQKLNPENPQDCDFQSEKTTLPISTIDTQKCSILPRLKVKIIETQPIKRSARIEQLMKKTCDDQLHELRSLIKKMNSPMTQKKEKKVTFLL